ncbi:hypothetical protein HG531_007997 [Fusarium graminearum]|nr:hypothetical protein HG531_007997 [Fusarium graminearum]
MRNPKISPTASIPNRVPARPSSTIPTSIARHSVGKPEPRAAMIRPAMTKDSLVTIIMQRQPEKNRKELERARMEYRKGQSNCIGIKRMMISVCVVASGIVMTAPGRSQTRGQESIDLTVASAGVFLGNSKLRLSNSRP